MVPSLLSLIFKNKCNHLYSCLLNVLLIPNSKFQGDKFKVYFVACCFPNIWHSVQTTADSQIFMNERHTSSISLSNFR